MAAIVALAVAAILVSGCISVVAEPTPTPTPAPTAPPTPPPTAPPTLPPTVEPTVEGSPGPTGTGLEDVDLRPYLTAGLSVLNLADDTITLTARLVNTDTNEEFSVGDYSALPEQSATQQLIPARYHLIFSYPEGSSAVGGECTIDVGDTDAIQFVAVNNGLVVIKNGVEPTDTAEAVITTSSLCHAGAQ